MARLLTSKPADIERFVGERRTAPLRLWACASTELPDPAAWPGSLITLSDLLVPAFSDGTAWYPITLGSAL